MKTLERKSKFARNDFSGHAAGYVKTIREQVVAANFDYVFIMQSLNHDLNPRRLERYLTLAWQSGAVPIIVLTKADLTDRLEEQLKEICTAASGADLCAVSRHVAWLHSLAIRHGPSDSHVEKTYEYQRKGIGTEIVMYGLQIAKALGYTACMTCGNPAVYRKKMGFQDYRELGISKDSSVEDPDCCIFALELEPDGFRHTNKLLSFSYYDFSK